VTRSLNRREFLAGGAALASAASLPAAVPQIIDTHIHLYDPTRPQGVPWPPGTDPLLYQPMLPGAYAALVRPLGVTGAVVVEASQWMEDNQWVLDLAKEHPVIVGLVGHLEPAAEGFAANLARFAKNPLFRGIRLNGDAIAGGMARPAFVEDIQRLADAGLMLDAIGNAAMIPALTALTTRIPKLRIAIDHMPAEPAGWRNSRADLLELARRPQVYCKVSGVLKQVDGKVPEDLSAYQTALDEVWHAFGPDRVMYGSNWPVSNRLSPYETVLKVVQQYVHSKAAGDADKFFRRNSKACYQWLDRG
jgi:predicted TIM-barrel fold metal-dependent hydrolase